ncbi:MAG: hypothetical protein KDB60_01020 [Propionibacteriaceae bacterium]|nr:hypothetical protein [Propionibacteriaceae bacterium]
MQKGAMFGYAWGQFQKALTSFGASPDPEVRARAEKRANSWVQVLNGMLSGRIRIGSRTPVKGFPDWLTPEIVRGGFATGAAAAGGPPHPDEIILAERVGVPVNRASLFAWFLSDDGLAQLNEWLDSGHYQVFLPEHGALLVVAHLLRRGDSDAAEDLLRTLEPWAGRIRFWPFEAVDSEAVGVHVATVPEVSRRLARKRPQRQVEAEREALTIWAPFTDRVVAHWWLTRTEAGGLDTTFPPGWDAGARALLEEYEQLAAQHRLTHKHADPKGNLQHLLAGFRARLAAPPGTPSMGKVRWAVACIVEKRGEPGSPTHTALRERQASTAERPSHAALAHEVAAALDATGVTGAVPRPELLVDGSEGARLESVQRVLRQATQAPLPDLLGRGIVHSAETLAVLAPQLTADTVASRYPDPVAGALAKALYVAFSNRRSVLLLDLESQVRIDAIPWFTALERCGARDDRGSLAHAQAADLATLALRHFAGTMLPNSLVRELARLYKLAGEDVPLTYELAADIFMGSFSPVFQRAAQEAATVVGGTLYARYYDIDYAAISRMGTSEAASWPGLPPRTTVPEFDRLAHARAGATDTRRSWSPATNGKTIEQAQILTTQNLAVLLRRGVDLDPAEQARAAWNATWAHLAKAANGHRLRHRKNAAFAWRQTVFYLSQGSSHTVAQFIENAQPNASGPGEVAEQAALMLRGLAEAQRGGPPTGGPFLGWVTRDAE